MSQSFFKIILKLSYDDNFLFSISSGKTQTKFVPKSSMFTRLSNINIFLIQTLTFSTHGFVDYLNTVSSHGLWLQYSIYAGRYVVPGHEGLSI